MSICLSIRLKELKFRIKIFEFVNCVILIQTYIQGSIEKLTIQKLKVL